MAATDVTRGGPPPLPSDRRFAVFFGALFCCLAAWEAYSGSANTAVITCATAGLAFLLAAVCCPKLVAPLNRAWFRLGGLMGRVINPLVLGAIFFLIITPVALMLKLMGRDELRLKRGRQESYWVARKSTPRPESFKNPF
jgi:hypothetical protein